jgi:hypothetical protein
LVESLSQRDRFAVALLGGIQPIGIIAVFAGILVTGLTAPISGHKSLLVSFEYIVFSIQYPVSRYSNSRNGEGEGVKLLPTPQILALENTTNLPEAYLIVIVKCYLQRYSIEHMFLVCQ